MPRERRATFAYTTRKLPKMERLALSKAQLQQPAEVVIWKFLRLHLPQVNLSLSARLP